MPSFSYVAREAASGKEIRNVIEANTEQEAIANLLGRNLLVVAIQEASGKKGKPTSGAVALQDLVMFTRQLATMIDAGIPIVGSLQGLAEQTDNKIMRDVIRDICARVESGDNFSAALMKHPKTFERLYYCMVDAGEKGGLLAEILARLATYLENTVRLQKKVKSAMMYPTIVTIVAVTITCFLLVKVVPTFGEIFSGFGAKLPAPTQLLIDLSAWMIKWWWVILLSTGGGIWGWFQFIKTKTGEEFWDKNRIRLPVFGHIAHKICLARFARTPASLGRHPVFPVMIVRMLSAGEQTGKIDAMLERVADFLDDEIETILNGLTSLIEPLLIVFLGVTVGSIVIAMFLPIFKMSEIISPSR